MAKKAKAQAAPAVEVDEVDYTKWADKEATDLQARFATWIQDKTEIDPKNFASKQEAFEEGVRLAVALRMPFQRSPENQAVNGRAAKAERAEVEEVVTAAAKKTKKAKASAPAEDDDTADSQLERPKRKVSKKTVRKPVAVEVDEDEVAEETAAAKPAKKTRRAPRRGDTDAAF